LTIWSGLRILPFVALTTTAQKAMATTKHQFMQKEGFLNPKPERVLHPLFIDKALPFFDPLDLPQVRYEMLHSARAEQTSVTEASKLFGFSRKQFYKLERLFLARGYVSLLGSPRGRRSLIALNTEIRSKTNSKSSVRCEL
jgi:hypothetical protein